MDLDEDAILRVLEEAVRPVADDDSEDELIDERIEEDIVMDEMFR